MSDIREDCLFLNDVECPYAQGHEICEGCDTYEEDTSPHPLDEDGRADYLLGMKKDKEMNDVKNI